MALSGLNQHQHPHGMNYRQHRLSSNSYEHPPPLTTRHSTLALQHSLTSNGSNHGDSPSRGSYRDSGRSSSSPRPDCSYRANRRRVNWDEEKKKKGPDRPKSAEPKPPRTFGILSDLQAPLLASTKKQQHGKKGSCTSNEMDTGSSVASSYSSSPRSPPTLLRANSLKPNKFTFGQVEIAKLILEKKFSSSIGGPELLIGICYAPSESIMTTSIERIKNIPDDTVSLYLQIQHMDGSVIVDSKDVDMSGCELNRRIDGGLETKICLMTDCKKPKKCTVHVQMWMSIEASGKVIKMGGVQICDRAVNGKELSHWKQVMHTPGYPALFWHSMLSST